MCIRSVFDRDIIIWCMTVLQIYCLPYFFSFPSGTSYHSIPSYAHWYCPIDVAYFVRIFFIIVSLYDLVWIFY